MVIRFCLLLIISLSLLLSVNPVFSEENLNDILSRRNIEEKEICNIIKTNLKKGIDAQEVTRTSIEMGNKVCYVVKCAIDGGGDLRQIIAGAMEAGATSDVVSRCAVDAGAEPELIAQIFESLGVLGLGYSPLLEEGLIPIEAGLPGGTTGGGTISPSSF